MRYDVMKAYLLLCELYGWPQSFKGLRAFVWQLKHGYRSIWLGEEEHINEQNRTAHVEGTGDGRTVSLLGGQFPST